jgi:hypothetical protein
MTTTTGDPDTPADTRVTVSLSTLRAELVSMELRLVDRLNGALANKADRALLEQTIKEHAETNARLVILEQRAVVRDSPFVQRVEDLDTEMTSLREVSKYKKWLWAQTIALVAIAVPVLGYALQHLSGN